MVGGIEVFMIIGPQTYYSYSGYRGAHWLSCPFGIVPVVLDCSSCILTGKACTGVVYIQYELVTWTAHEISIISSKLSANTTKVPISELALT